MDRLVLTKAVGKRKPNCPSDVLKVQACLNKHSYVTRLKINENGLFDTSTQRALLRFQLVAMGMIPPDGIVDVSGATNVCLRNLTLYQYCCPFPVPPAGEAKSGVLTQADYQQAATTLNCEVPAIKAVAMVEAGRITKRVGNKTVMTDELRAFDSEGRPTILYERKIFQDLTQHLYDVTHHDLSAPHEKGEYNTPSYPKLERAYRLDQDAALKSASWGAFQIMGANHKAAGFSSVQIMVAAMRQSAREHLNAFVNFINNDSNLVNAITKKNWAAFAASYNGKGYKANDYDTKLANAYAEASKPTKK
ncbi:MAG: N-acetylmuramidase family protein [Terracidiphilus sp.]|jgi:hypothetical protein